MPTHERMKRLDAMMHNILEHPVKRVALWVLAAAFMIWCPDDGDAFPSHSGSATEGIASGSRDACALITKAEVDAILRTSVTPKPSSDSRSSSCDFIPAGSGDGFSLKVFWTGGKDELATTKKAMRIAPKMMKAGGINPAGMMALEPVDGLGDEAYFNAIVGSSVLKGDILLEFDLRLVSFHLSEPEKTAAVWKALTSKALARL